MQIQAANRAAAAEVHTGCRGTFLAQIPGALTKQLLVLDVNVQVLHGFDSMGHAQAYLRGEMFRKMSLWA